MLDRSHLGGVVPVMAMFSKSWHMTLWNAGGMCFSRATGTLSGLGAFFTLQST